MRIQVDALEARRVVDEVGEDKVVRARRRRVGGAGPRGLSLPAIRSWVLGLLDHATIIEPASFRDELVAWLEELAEPAPGRPAEPVVAAATEEGGTGAAASPETAPGAETSRRLRRLLAVVGGWRRSGRRRRRRRHGGSA